MADREQKQVHTQPRLFLCTGNDGSTDQTGNKTLVYVAVQHTLQKMTTAQMEVQNNKKTASGQRINVKSAEIVNVGAFPINF
jgi:hypothetical protein